ncbi:MAG: hypothetical protein CMI56_01045 [Parcubacteria group bacterium]|nr:hypothetical protein [Parcubacteria group bacterium]|tara:strand:- start:3414 stop:4556 length:1143 start_codon:yes stop_codon:yes gene_type:complete
MSIEGGISSTPSQPKSNESLESSRHKANAVVFVPGLTEGPAIFDVVAKRMHDAAKERGSKEEGASLDAARLYVVSTHDEYESAAQQNISAEVAAKDAERKERIEKKKNANFLVKPFITVPAELETPERAPIMSVVSDSETHHSNFENRVRLAEKAMEEATTPETENISIIGHSAGGAAVLAAVANEVARRNELDTAERKKLPGINAVLVAPAVPGDVDALVTVAPTFVGVVLADFFKKALTLNFSEMYIKQLVMGEDIVARRKDIEKISGPLNDESYKKAVLDSAVPLSGGEGMDLLQYPKVLGDLTPEDWPEDVTIDVIVPKSDKWVSAKGQTKLVDDVLTGLMGDKARKHSVPGGHLPLGEDGDTAELVAALGMSTMK